MERRKFLILIAALVVFIFLLNSLAIKFYWYYSIWWFDMPMHFLGGFWISLAILYLFRINQVNLSLIIKVFLGFLMVGFGWEIFELIFKNILAGESFNLLDALSDLAFDSAGGFFGLFLFQKRFC